MNKYPWGRTIRQYRLGIVLSSIGVGLIIIPFIIVIVVYWEEMSFSPLDFINEGFKFIIGIVSMLISFWISQVYWERRMEQVQIARVYDMFHYHLDRAAIITGETKKALARHIQDASESIQRDQAVLANLRRLGDVRANTLRLLDVSGQQLRWDQRLSLASAHFRSVLAPVLERLSERPQVRPWAEAIAKDLALVEEEIEKIVLYLREECDELNPSG